MGYPDLVVIAALLIALLGFNPLDGAWAIRTLRHRPFNLRELLVSIP